MNMPVMTLPEPDERIGMPAIDTPADVVVSGDTRDPMDLVVLLLRRLQARRPDMVRWDRYYRGEHPLSWFTDAFREAFAGRFHRFASNFAQLVVDGQSERMEVQGFRFLDAGGDQSLWDVWQDNNLDGASQQAHTDALIKGASYALVEPRSDARPTITVEDALGAITLDDPRDRRRRLAGLKTWIDDTGRMVVYLYLPDAVYTYRSERPVSNGWVDWLRGEARMIRSRLLPWVVPGQDAWPMVNPLGVVPLVPILNRPLLDGIGRSEVDPITSNQDAINYYRAAALIAGRYVAVPQRYIYGLDLEVDPTTGRPVRPFVTAEGRPADLWAIGNPDPDQGAAKPLFPPQIGQFPAADVTQYIKLIESEVWQMASISRMPYQELLGQPSSIPQSGEGLKASEAPLLRKVGKAEVFFGEGWEEVMRVALRAMGDERADLRTAETLWQSAETRNEAVRTDSVVKQRAADLIDAETALEELGYTPARIARVQERLAAEKATEPDPHADVTDLEPAPTGPRMSPVLSGS